MPAQGIALGIGSGVDNSNALKGQNRFVVKNLLSPFQGWADFSFGSDPRALPIGSQGVALGFPVSAPSGRQKSATPKVPTQDENLVEGRSFGQRMAGVFPTRTFVAHV